MPEYQTTGLRVVYHNHRFHRLGEFLTLTETEAEPLVAAGILRPAEPPAPAANTASAPEPDKAVPEHATRPRKASAHPSKA